LALIIIINYTAIWAHRYKLNFKDKKMQSPSTIQYSLPFSTYSISETHASRTSSENNDTTVNASQQTRPVQTAAILNLPLEMLIEITRWVTGTQNILKLMTTCTGFKSVVEQTLMQQYNAFKGELVGLNLGDFSNYKDNIKGLPIPDPYTSEWRRLRYRCLDANLSAEDQIKALYITTWDLLLLPKMINNRLQALDLMKILIDLSHYINDRHSENTICYAAKLFPKGFPRVFFDQLASLHLDRCMQLIAKHFKYTRDPRCVTLVDAFLKAQAPSQGEVLYAKFSSLYKGNIQNARNDKKLSDLGIGGLYAGIAMIDRGYARSLLFYVGQFFYSHGPGVTGPAPEVYRNEVPKALLQKLFDKGCDLEQINQNEETVLIYVMLIAGLLRTKNDFYDIPYEYRPTTDTKYNAERTAYLVQRLLQQGANCNARDKKNNTPLIIACQYKLEKLVPLLLQYPVEVDARNNDGLSALDYAITNGNLAAIEALLKKSEYYTLLFAFRHAILLGKDEVFSTFLHNIDAQEKREFIQQAFTLAIEEEQLSVAETLHEKYGAINK
jgi:hypothetical protein